MGNDNNESELNFSININQQEHIFKIKVSKDFDKHIEALSLMLDNIKKDSEKKIEEFVNLQSTKGITRKVTDKELAGMIENNTGFYKELIENQEKVIKEYFKQHNMTNNDNIFYKWRLGPCKGQDEDEWAEWELIDNEVLIDDDMECLKEERNYCNTCLYQASRGILSIEQFPVPGFQPTHGRGNCNENCMCELEIVNNK